MERTQIYLSKDEQGALTKEAEKTGKSKSQLIREAIDAYLKKPGDKERQAIIAKTKGMWKGRQDLPDFDALRSEWDR